MQNAIPEHSEASRATAKGNVNITKMVTASHIVMVLLIPIKTYPGKSEQKPCLLN